MHASSDWQKCFIITDYSSLISCLWRRHRMETFSALLAICAGNSPVPVNSPHKGQWRGTLMFSLICTRINCGVNNREAGDLRRNRADYDVIVMCLYFWSTCKWIIIYLYDSMALGYHKLTHCLGTPQEPRKIRSTWINAWGVGPVKIRDTNFVVSSPADVLLIESLGIYFSEIPIRIQQFWDIKSCLQNGGYFLLVSTWRVKWFLLWKCISAVLNKSQFAQA